MSATVTPHDARCLARERAALVVLQVALAHLKPKHRKAALQRLRDKSPPLYFDPVSASEFRAIIAELVS